MAIYETVVTDGDGKAVAGAKGYVYVKGVLAALTDDLGAPLANPITTDALGHAKATVPNPFYTVHWSWLGRERLVEAFNSAATITAVDTDGTLAANSDTVVASQKATKTYITTAISNLGLGTASTATLDTDGTFAANSATRVPAQSAVKTYVDNKVAGLSWKQAVRAATTAAGTLATSFANGQTVDGVVLATGDRILIKNQAAPAENGIYTVNASGAPTRATDADTGAELVNASCYVSSGTTNADTQWTCSTDGPITLGTTGLTFAQAGTVSSVALSLPAIFTVTGSPVTSTGTLTATLASQSANLFFAAPNGSAGAPAFRAIAVADVPTLNQNTTGSAGSVANAVTFNTTGGAAAGSTFNGSAARTVDYSTVGASPARPTIATVSASFSAADADNNSHKVASGASQTLTLGSITAGTSLTVRFTTAWSLSCAGGLSKNGAAPGGVTTGSVAANSLITFLHEGSGVWVATGSGLT